MAAGRLFSGTSQQMEAIQTVVNRGEAAFRSGDLPAALAFLAEAASRYAPLDVPTPFLSFDRCNVLLAAGLATDALAEADAAIRDIEQARGWTTKKAELLLMAAQCALAAAQPQVRPGPGPGGLPSLPIRQHSAWWQARAGLALVQARYAAGPASARLLNAADQAAARLTALGSAEQSQAHLLAGRVALDLGRRDDADRHLIVAARSRRSGPAMSRASGWLSEALRAEAAAHPRRLLAACRRGLAVLDEYRFTLGASELRAQATAHGAQLAVLAQRHAARAHQPRLFLAWRNAGAPPRWRSPRYAPRPTRRSLTVSALREITSWRMPGAGHAVGLAPAGATAAGKVGTCHVAAGPRRSRSRRQRGRHRGTP